MISGNVIDTTAFLEAAPDAIIVVESSGNIAYVNRQAELLFGWTRADVVGLTIDMLIPPKLRAAHAQHRAHFARTPIARPMGSGHQLRAVRADGSEFPVEVSLSPVDLPSGVHIIAAIRDLSERQQVEEAMRTSATTLDCIGDGVVATDRHGRVCIMNRTAESLLEWSASDARGRTLDDVAVLVDEQSGAVRSWVAPGEVRQVDGHGLVLRSRSGRMRTISDSVAPVIDPAGEVSGIVWVFRDVSAEKLREAQLIVADRMLSMATVATGLAHELNNPLTSVLANIDFAIETVEAGIATATEANLSRLHEDLIEARRGGHRMRGLVRDVSSFLQEPHFDTRVDVNHVVEAALRVVPRTLRDDVQIVRALTPVPPVAASQSRLGQVFLNLLVNAFQAVPRDASRSAEVRLSSGVADGAVFIEVADNGEGMTPEVQARIFTPFFTTKSKGGTGLGLAIGHAIIAAAGGTITVRTAPGQGAAFRVTLPTSPCEADVPCVEVRGNRDA